MKGIGSVVAGGVPVGFRVTWDRIVPGLESIPVDIVPLDDATHDLGSATKRFAEAHVSDFLALGTTPASAGVLRIPNNTWIMARNAADDGDVFLLQADGNDVARILAALSVQGHIRPEQAAIYDLGSASLRWGAGYIDHPHFGPADAITASTTQSQGQQPLTEAVNRVSTVANANDVVTLPTAVAGMLCAIRNDGANTLQIFPASGDDINGGATDASTTLAAGSALILFAIDATSWYSFGAA